MYYNLEQVKGMIEALPSLRVFCVIYKKYTYFLKQ